MSTDCSTTRALYDEVYKQWLPEANTFARATGYFSVSALSAGAYAYSAFFANGGSMRLLTGEVMSYDSIAEKTESPGLSESDFRYHPFACFLQLLAQEKIIVKVATPRAKDNHGIFHAKYGILVVPNGPAISFLGSANETRPGIGGENYEETSVFDDASGVTATELLREFDLLWNNKDPNWAVRPYQPQETSQTGTLPQPSLPEGENTREHWRLEHRLTRHEAVEILRDGRHS